jgi:hypothetical protein
VLQYFSGEVYFRIVYPDASLLYPLVQSFVYIGKNLSDEDIEETWYFQFADDYAKNGSLLDGQEGDRKVCCENKETVSCMLDQDGLNEELEMAAARRLEMK